MATVYARKGESNESLIRRFKKKVEKEGILEEMSKKEYYISPSEKRRLEKKESEKRAAILARKLAKFDKKSK